MRVLAALLFAPLSFAASACDQTMEDQPKYEAYEDRPVPRDPPEGTVARGDLAARAALRNRPPLTRALLDRGEEHYRVNCAPCHGLTGHGRGMIVRRGFPRPPSFHSDRLRRVRARHFVEVITRGHGVMYAYSDRVRPADRWAVAAHIRALQISQRTRLADLPEAIRRRFEENRR